MNILFKPTLFLLFLVFSKISIGYSQTSYEKQIVMDGIMLASKLGSKDFIYLEKFTNENNFKLDLEETTSNFLYYYKGENNSVMGLVIDLRESSPRIGFILVGEEFAFFIPKIKSILDNNENFEKLLENNYVFHIQNNDHLSRGEDTDLCETFEFISIIEFSNDSPIIDFHRPYCNEKPTLLDERLLQIISQY